MGYRSEITAVFYTHEKDEWPLLKLFVDENFPKDLAGFLEEESEEPRKTWGFVFRVADYKWYDSWPEVQAFNEFEERFQAMDKHQDGTWNFEFVRIGEDYTDVEHRSSDHHTFILEVVRRVEVNL